MNFNDAAMAAAEAPANRPKVKGFSGNDYAREHEAKRERNAREALVALLKSDLGMTIDPLMLTLIATKVKKEWAENGEYNGDTTYTFAWRFEEHHYTGRVSASSPASIPKRSVS